MSYTFSILLKDLASSKISKISSGLTSFQSKVSRSQTKVQNKFGRTTQSINFLQKKLDELNRQRTASRSEIGIMRLNTQIRKTEKSLRRLENLPPLSFRQRLKSTAGALGGFIGVAGGLYMVRDSFRKMEEQMQAVGQVEAGLASTNGKVGYSLEQLQQKASSLQSKTIFGDEAILQNSTAQLLTFTSVTGKSFDKAQQAALDMTSRVYGVKASGDQLKTTSIMLGKALNDPVANLGALSRFGAKFSKEQEEMIKKMAKSGDLAGAQAIMFQELGKQYGGSAEKAAKTGLGPLKQLQGLFADLQEKLASGFLPILNSIVNTLKPVAEWLNNNGEIITKITPWVVGFGVAILGVKKIMAGYRLTIMLASVATKIWQGVQVVFNSTMWSNPITWVVAGIIALIAAIGYVIYKTDGWGKAWQHTVNGAKLLFKAFTMTAKAHFNTMVNGIMIGINKIKEGWYKFKDAVGLGDSSENKKMLAKIQADTEARKESIKAGYKKAAQTAVEAASEFVKAGQSLKWNSDKKMSDVTSSLKKKLGIAPPPTALPTNDDTENTTDATKTNGLGTAAQTIAGGGSKQTHINITIEKLQDDTKIFVSEATQGLEDLGDKVQEILLRAVNSVNQMQTT